MGRAKTSLDWIVLAAGVTAAMVLLFVGINALEETEWMRFSSDNSTLGVLVIIAVMAVVNCGVLLGIAYCCARSRLRG